jgi:hypothetical protein
MINRNLLQSKSKISDSKFTDLFNQGYYLSVNYYNYWILYFMMLMVYSKPLMEESYLIMNYYLQKVFKY